MGIFLSLLRIIVHLLCSPLPTSGITSPSGSTNPLIPHAEVTEGSYEDTKAMDTVPSSTSPQRISESIQNAYLPSALRMMGITQSFVASEPAPSDFWEKAKEKQGILQEYIPRLLKSVALLFNSVSSHITQAASAMDNIVNATATLRKDIQGTLDAHNITLDAFTKELEGVFTVIVNNLQKIPAPEKVPGHAERTELVDKILADMTLALKDIAARYGIERAVETYLSVIKPHVRALVVAIGDISERHPQLVHTLLFSVAGLLIPESWFLRPFLSVFGFGPCGPVKGSAAAWLQSRFWGGTVAAGSWFALLQAAGMGGVIPWWLGPIVRLPLTTGAKLLGALLT